MYSPPTDDFTKDFDELGLAKPNESGKAPRERLTSPDKLRDIHVRLREDDRVNAFNRARAQALLDGEPPYDEADLEDAPDMTNLNFQGAEEQLERAKTPYDRILNSGENLLYTPTTYGSIGDGLFYTGNMRRPRHLSVLQFEVRSTAMSRKTEARGSILGALAKWSST